MHYIECSRAYAKQILAIYNDAILHTTAVYEYEERSPNYMEAWFSAKEQGSYPVVGLVDDESGLLGFSTYGPFRPRPAYQYTVEHSVYVQKDHRGKGLGKLLLGSIIEKAKAQGYHCMVAGIDSRNTASRRLHEGMGFNLSGTMHEVGFKFDTYLDLCFYQLILPQIGIEAI